VECVEVLYSGKNGGKCRHFLLTGAFLLTNFKNNK